MNLVKAHVLKLLLLKNPSVLPFLPMTTRSAWLIGLCCCLLLPVHVEPQKLVPYISVHDVTDQHDACAVP